MEITLYNVTDNPKKVEKTLDSGLQLNCNVYDNCNILNPNIILRYNVSYLSYNYCYIPTFNRYYFLKTPTVSPGKRIIFPSEVDVLQTYASEIKELNCTVVRNEYVPTSKLTDSFATFTSEKEVVGLQFSSTPFNIRDITPDSMNFILTLGGGFGS